MHAGCANAAPHGDDRASRRSAARPATFGSSRACGAGPVLPACGQGGLPHDSDGDSPVPVDVAPERDCVVEQLLRVVLVHPELAQFVAGDGQGAEPAAIG